MLTILIDGIAYGMLLFVMASGLAVTLGLMNFVNLAHGAFAMLGGYVTALAMNRLGLPFLATLPLAFLASAALGAIAERTLYVWLYRRSHLDQVLFSIALVFMSMAAADWLVGSQQQLITLPAWLQGRLEIAGVAIGRYRLFLILVCAALVVALQLILARTRFGARLRAAVDNQRVARGLGINVSAIFAATFAVGSGLAGLGGALGIELLGLDPSFPLKILVYVMIVVTIGGTSSLTGPFIAALIIGVADVAGKYYLPELGAFLIYLMMIVLLVLRPQGLIASGR
ncbi:branched-chain amino acid ABC transporter permease [Rhizobium sp. SSA_523]|uniref:branched-chain amino acid ABC transporter permease n=1 Tax=Rhizobium sp. SSA_523 TaxID=2952477 RepID=UPI0020914452|nr:branched-chain amino acid ABC transporter permease [Rhizobium sp. SSA_523]MCO5733428.1 branched-chain amino acid ABC transporter permease [Rhizobium sp. SSA_523]WKC21600.1 branched-chain amino acid ABC transporter permease [Rhizobium sp. SSA_523]